MKGKRGQFFILAAVILSAIIVSMAVANNYVLVDKEPDKFYDRSYEMKEESLRVIDYGIFNDKDKIFNFTEIYIENWRNQDPDAEIIVIYGDENNIRVENHGKGDIEVQGEDIPGRNEVVETNHITLTGAGGMTVGQAYGDYLDDWIEVVSLSEEEKTINVTINDKEYEFKLAENQQFFIIATKTLGQEEHVIIQ